MKWTKEASDAATKAGDDFQQNVRRIALRLANHSDNLYVDQQHVNEAVGVLKRIGLKQRRWFARPELKVGTGIAIFTLSFSASDAINSVRSVWPTVPEVLGFALMLAGILLGFAITVWGWLADRT